MFERQEDGCFLGVLTEKAIEFGGGDNDRIVAAAFARFLHQHGIEFAWLPSLHFNIDERWQDVAVRATSTTDAQSVRLEPAGAHTVAGRVAGSLVALHGITFAEQWAALTEKHAGEVPTNQLLSLGSWVLAFPHLWPTHNDGGIRAWQAKQLGSRTASAS
jgi:hypothetical protein